VTGGEFLPDGSWADPLSRSERSMVAGMLARACNRFYNLPAGTPGAMLSQIIASAEMSDLRLDVTERAKVPMTECRHHGEVPDDHFPCRAPGETAGQFTNRALGYWRDV